jgi:hypothetical protein
MPTTSSTTSWSLGGLVLGHAALATCAVFYLIWWWLFFDPNRLKPQGGLYVIGVICILVAVACGLAGVAGIASGLASIHVQAEQRGVPFSPFPAWAILCGAAVAYVALMLVTRLVFERQVTTELVLIVGWTALEVGVINSLASATIISPTSTTSLAVTLGLLFVLSMTCYVLYYRLGPFASFVDGCIPLVAVGVFSVALVVTLRML